MSSERSTDLNRNPGTAAWAFVRTVLVAGLAVLAVSAMIVATPYVILHLGYDKALHDGTPAAVGFLEGNAVMLSYGETLDGKGFPTIESFAHVKRIVESPYQSNKARTRLLERFLLHMKRAHEKGRTDLVGEFQRFIPTLDLTVPDLNGEFLPESLRETVTEIP